MTPEQLAKVPFQFVCSMALEHEHTITYKNDDYNIGFCDHTIKRKDGGFGRTYRHYRLRNKVYKTLPKFLEAIKDIIYNDGNNPDNVIFLNSKK